MIINNEKNPIGITIKREKFHQIKKNNLINAKNYELDKETLKQYYPYFKLQERPENIYKIVEKKTILFKEINNKNAKEKVLKRDYYCNYKSFREYLSTGKNYNYVINELEKIKSVLNFSKELRKEICNKFELPFNKENNEISIQLPYEKNEVENSILNLTNSNLNTSNSKGQRRVSAIFNLVKNPNSKSFIEKCFLLKERKKKLDNNGNNYLFRLFTKYEKDSDIYNFPKFDGFNNNIFHNQNWKLTKLFYLENKFINIADLKNKSSQISIQSKINVDNLLKLKILKYPYIQAFFKGRERDYFKEMDNFVGIYRENSQAIKNNEKDLFNSLYNILTKCNSDCSHFMQYLYSKSYMFKYIYDIFIIENKLDIMDKENVPMIQKEILNEPFLNDSIRQFFSTSNTEFQPGQIKNTIHSQKLDNEILIEEENNFVNNFEDLFGNKIMEKIGFCNEQLTILLKNQDKNIKNLISLMKDIPYEFYLVINNEDKFIIYKPNFDSSNKEIYSINVNIKSLKLYVIDENRYNNELFQSNIDLSEENIVLIKIYTRKNLLTKEQNKELADKFFIFKIKKESLKIIEQNQSKLISSFSDDLLKEIKSENDSKIISENLNNLSNTNSNNRISLDDIINEKPKDENREDSKSSSISITEKKSSNESSEEEETNEKLGNNSILKFMRKQVKKKTNTDSENKEEIKTSIFNSSKYSDNLVSD